MPGSVLHGVSDRVLIESFRVAEITSPSPIDIVAPHTDLVPCPTLVAAAVPEACGGCPMPSSPLGVDAYVPNTEGESYELGPHSG